MRIERLNCKEAAAVAQRYACAPPPDTNTQTRKTHEIHEQQQQTRVFRRFCGCGLARLSLRPQNVRGDGSFII